MRRLPYHQSAWRARRAYLQRATITSWRRLVARTQYIRAYSYLAAWRRRRGGSVDPRRVAHVFAPSLWYRVDAPSTSLRAFARRAACRTSRTYRAFIISRASTALRGTRYHLFHFLHLPSLFICQHFPALCIYRGVMATSCAALKRRQRWHSLRKTRLANGASGCQQTASGAGSEKCAVDIRRASGRFVRV